MFNMEPPGRRKQRRAQRRFIKVNIERVAVTGEDPRDRMIL